MAEIDKFVEDNYDTFDNITTEKDRPTVEWLIQNCEDCGYWEQLNPLNPKECTAHYYDPKTNKLYACCFNGEGYESCQEIPETEDRLTAMFVHYNKAEHPLYVVFYPDPMDPLSYYSEIVRGKEKALALLEIEQKRHKNAKIGRIETED